MENIRSSLDRCLFLLPILMHAYIFFKGYHQNKNYLITIIPILSLQK